LGEIEVAKIDIQGDWSPLAKFKMPLTFVSRGRLGTALNKLIYRPLIKPRLRVNPSLCTQCEICVQHCPAQALTMKEIPCLDKKKCITCYCCYELCSSQAIELTGLMRRITKSKPLKYFDKLT
jgi:ferredoxin